MIFPMFLSPLSLERGGEGGGIIVTLLESVLQNSLEFVYEI